MPLVEVTLNPNFMFSETWVGDGPDATKHFVRKVFGPKLPSVFVDNTVKFGMDPTTPEAGVQVRFHDYGADDVNIADLWITVQFSEDEPEESTRIEIRDAVFGAIANTIHDYEIKMPDNFILDVFWGPTNGCGSVNGVYIEW